MALAYGGGCEVLRGGIAKCIFATKEAQWIPRGCLDGRRAQAKGLESPSKGDLSSKMSQSPANTFEGVLVKRTKQRAEESAPGEN